MKRVIMLSMFLLLIVGCADVQDSPPIKTAPALSETSELVLSVQDLAQLGMIGDNLAQLSQLGISADNGSDCKTEKYPTNEYSLLAEYSICSYLIPNLNDTQVVIELKKFATVEALNGTYQYDSLHLYSIEGLISENDFGDMSRFRVSDVHDYGGEFNDPSISYYNLWIGKNEYLIHITSKGEKGAKEPIAQIGHIILSKFE